MSLKWAARSKLWNFPPPRSVIGGGEVQIEESKKVWVSLSSPYLIGRAPIFWLCLDLFPCLGLA
jgi:hypothetical protein